MSKYTDMLQEPEQENSGLVQGGTNKYTGMLSGETQPRSARDFIQQFPVPENMKVNRDPERGASMGTLATSSFADDPAKKISYLASKRFPDMPIEDAMQRYMYKDGEISYLGDDGRIYSETPTMMDIVASKISGGIPIVAGIGTGIATAPMWLAGPGGAAASAGLTAGAGAGGEAIRQAIGGAVMDDPFSVGDVAMEGAFGLGGEVVGGVAARVMNRNVAKDIARMDAEDVALLQRLSEKYGISLTPAELTNLPSLKSQQKALGNLTGSADELDDFYRMRAGEVEGAVEKQLDTISPVDSPEIAGVQVRMASERSIKAARAARSAEAKPFYESVVTPDNVLSDDAFKAIDADEYLSGVVERVKGDKLLDMGDYQSGSLSVLDEAKKRLDGQIGAAKRAGNNNKVRLLQAKKEKLLKIVDEAFPDYPAARAAFAGKSPEVDALEGGIVGIISKLKDTSAKSAAAKLFDPASSGPQAVAEARRVIGKSDPEAWQAIKRSWLGEQWDKAGKEFATAGSANRGGKFRALLIGDKRRQKILKAGLDESEYKALDELSTVLDAASRVKRVGSDTAWNQELMKIERDKARPFLAKLASKMRVLSWPKMFDDWATERNLRNIADKTVEIITSPNGMSRLKELRQVSPGSARLAVLTAHLLGIGAVSTPGAVDAMKQDQQ